ncbi:hypothetical protein SLS64_009602 [Diaporthe eres]|uniref:F-box domain-containing protein n=1 Tax=Diaporthe eres TaxID=83184 RepID=A0ABR1NU69_DIAER
MENNKNRIDDSDVDTKANDLKKKTQETNELLADGLQADQGDDAAQLDKVDQVEGHMEEARSSPAAITAKNQALFFTLPAELRIQIYAMVIADMPSTKDLDHPVGDFDLCQPALAKVNRQLRGEVLHMWYREKSFGICIHPKWHSEVEKVWQDFVGRFKAHTAGADGSHHLSRVRRLQVELWHPSSYERACDYYYRRRRPGETPLWACNGVYVRFGADGKPPCHSVGVVNNNWTDRSLARGLLKASIVGTRRDWSPDNLEQFWETYPLERLVDLVMMIAGECKEAAGSLHISTSMPPAW